MMSVKIFFLCFFVFVLALVIQHNNSNTSSSLLDPSVPYKCEKILDNIAFGPEDLAYSRQNNLLVVSSHNRRNESSLGSLYFIDANTGKQLHIQVPFYPNNFRPHGIAIFEEGSRTRLFVVSHRNVKGTEHAIEVFDYNSEGGFTYSHAIVGSELISPNDLIAIGFNELLVSNDHCTSNRFLGLLYDIFQQPCSEIVYFNGFNWKILNSNVLFGNGLITIKSPSETLLLRSSSASYKLYTYRVSISGALAVLNDEKLPISPDNIEYDDYSTGVLIAGHVSTIKFMMHTLLGFKSPSAVLVYYGHQNYSLLYYSDGSELSGCSVAVRTANGTLYIGQVFDPFVLRCTAIK